MFQSLSETQDETREQIECQKEDNEEDKEEDKEKIQSGLTELSLDYPEHPKHPDCNEIFKVMNQVYIHNRYNKKINQPASEKYPDLEYDSHDIVEFFM